MDCNVGMGGLTATVLDGDNAWYTKVIFSNLPKAVIGAELVVDGESFSMQRSGGATWSASPGGKTGAAAFLVTLEGGQQATLDACFDNWPVATGASCTAGTAA